MADENDQQQQEQPQVLQDPEEENPVEQIADNIIENVEEEHMMEDNAEASEEIEEEYEDEEDDDEVGPAGCRRSDSEEKKYKEYKQLVKEIKCQNEVINNLKKSILDMMRKPCNTTCEKADLKNFLSCMDSEMTRLRDLINKAMNLQNFGANRFYKPIELATSFEEEQFS